VQALEVQSTAANRRTGDGSGLFEAILGTTPAVSVIGSASALICLLER